MHTNIWRHNAAQMQRAADLWDRDGDFQWTVQGRDGYRSAREEVIEWSAAYCRKYDILPAPGKPDLPVPEPVADPHAEHRARTSELLRAQGHFWWRCRNVGSEWLGWHHAPQGCYPGWVKHMEYEISATEPSQEPAVEPHAEQKARAVELLRTQGEYWFRSRWTDVRPGPTAAWGAWKHCKKDDIDSWPGWYTNSVYEISATSQWTTPDTPSAGSHGENTRKPVESLPHAQGRASIGVPDMTLRDWFAGQALAGLLASSPDHPATTRAYDQADMMLGEKMKREGESTK